MCSIVPRDDAATTVNQTPSSVANSSKGSSSEVGQASSASMSSVVDALAAQSGYDISRADPALVGFLQSVLQRVADIVPPVSANLPASVSSQGASATSNEPRIDIPVQAVPEGTASDFTEVSTASATAVSSQIDPVSLCCALLLSTDGLMSVRSQPITGSSVSSIEQRVEVPAQSVPDGTASEGTEDPTASVTAVSSQSDPVSL